jgi:hypothetical protein
VEEFCSGAAEVPCPADGFEPAGTPCIDTQLADCWDPYCDGAGGCDQDTGQAQCAPTGKPHCEISLSNFVWEDVNFNGDQDSELGLGSVAVSLIEDCSTTPVVLASQNTGVAGDYQFTVDAVDAACLPTTRELLVEVDDSNFSGVLAGFAASPQNAVADTVDSDCDPVTYQTDCTTYAADTDDVTLDCGFFDRIDVAVDIKPGSCPNSYNRGNKGVLPVSLVGTASFDVTQVDLTTLKLCLPGENPLDPGAACATPHEGPPGPHTVVDDVATPFGGTLCDCHELEGDGILDVMMKFKTEELVPALGLNSFAAGDVVPLELHGSLLPEYGELPFEGQDCVRFVPPGNPPNLLRVKSPRLSWIDITPEDDQLDGGGFGEEFDRTYPADTDATLTAAPTYMGRAFLGWKGDDGRLIPSQSVLFRVNGHIQNLEAVYEPPPQRRCGLGFELALLLPPLVWLARRRRRS